MKTPRKWRMSRVMVVPGTWQGSVEHFYHFLLGYFMPTVLWQERSGSEVFSVRDCGPMNPWFDLLRPGTDLEIMNPGQMLQRYVTHRQVAKVVRGWDDPRRFHRKSHVTFTDVMRARVGARNSVNTRPRITLVARAPSPVFYLSGASEAYGSGAAWRSIPNIPEIASALDPLGDVEVLDTAGLPPTDQIRTLASTDVLVAQHGAGLSNMIWMRPGAAVVEIQPPQLPTVDIIFSSLASVRGLAYIRVAQENDHAHVNPIAVRDAAQRVVRSSTTLIPSMPGSWPIRVVRQLPRRP